MRATQQQIDNMIKNAIMEAKRHVRNGVYSKKKLYIATEWMFRVIQQVDYHDWEEFGIYKLKNALRDKDEQLFASVKMMNYRRDYWHDKLETGEWIDNAISIRLREGEMKNLSEVARKAYMQYRKNKSH